MQPITDMFKTVTGWAKALSPNCRDVTQLQSRSLDGPLPLHAHIGMTIHLRLCKWCRRYGQQLRFMREKLQQEDMDLMEPPPRRLSAEAREQMKALMRQNPEN